MNHQLETARISNNLGGWLTGGTCCKSAVNGLYFLRVKLQADRVVGNASLSERLMLAGGRVGCLWSLWGKRQFKDLKLARLRSSLQFIPIEG